MRRRSVLSAPLVAMAGSAGAQVVSGTAPPVAATPAGADRERKTRQVGVSSTTYKVLTRETGGALFVLEQANQKPGGPPLHVHHGEDELFYALEGEYLVQVGDQRFALKPGDCVLGPRGVPHAWAFTGQGSGRLLLSYAPAGKMEAFFDAWTAHFKPGAYSSESDAALLRTYGMERLGPPILQSASAAHG